MANDKYKQSLSLCAFGQSRPPNVNDDASKGFSLGSIWSYEGRIYKLKNPANGAAEWFNSSQRFQQFSVYTVATEEVDLGVQTIQGVNQITSLFTAQANPADNGVYSWSGSSWSKPTFPFGVWLEEYDMMSGCLFTALDGTETGKGYVLNTGAVNFKFLPIGAGLETFFENISVGAGVATLDCQGKAFPRFLISSLDSSPLELVINNTFGVVELSIVIDIPSPNSDKGLITLPAFCYPTTYQINDNARYYSVKMTKYLGLLFCDFQPLSEVSLKQNIPQVKSASFVAQNDNNYVTNATATVTDPIPVNGKGYSVIVVAGTTTIDAIAYSIAGTKITRTYDGSSWITNTGGGGSFTQSTQAQSEAAFDNTNQTTPVVLEQTSALTPFNAWWLVQKIKTFFSTTANQTDSTNKRFVTDAEKVVIGNTSNTNSGNETASTIGALLTTDPTPLDSDFVVGWDGTFLLKTTWTNVKAFLKTYFDTVYQTVLSIVSDAEMQTGTENTKYATALRITTWWTWIKTQAQTIAGTWTFSALLTSGANIIFTNTSTATASSDGIRRSATNTLALFINAVDRVILTTTGVQMVGTVLFSSLTGSSTSVLNIDASGNVTRGLDIQSISTLRGRADVTVSGTSETTILTASDGTTLTINTGDINVLSARVEQSLRALYTTLTPSGTATFKIIWNSVAIYTKVVDLNAVGLDGLTARDFFVGVELTTSATGSSGILRGVFTLRTISTFLADETFTATGVNLTVSSALDLTITQSVANTWVTKIIDRKVI